jgi:hypothetical protein
MTRKLNPVDGDIFDIGQTVNGVSLFIFIDNKWYYYEARVMGVEYEYGHDSLTDLVRNDAILSYNEVKYLGNILDDHEFVEIKKEIKYGKD